MDLVTKLGTALYETHGRFCEELIGHGFDLDSYYDGSARWGDFTKVLVKVAQLRGVNSYDGYLKFFETVKQDGDQPASKQLFARVTGIYTPRTDNTQTDRTRAYRRRRADELVALREATALAWIDDNTDQAQEYINKITDKK